MSCWLCCINERILTFVGFIYNKNSLNTALSCFLLFYICFGLIVAIERYVIQTLMYFSLMMFLMLFADERYN